MINSLIYTTLKYLNLFLIFLNYCSQLDDMYTRYFFLQIANIFCIDYEYFTMKNSAYLASFFDLLMAISKANITIHCHDRIKGICFCEVTFNRLKRELIRIQKKKKLTIIWELLVLFGCYKQRSFFYSIYLN